MTKTIKNQFNPDYDTKTVIIGKADLDRISEILYELTCVPSELEQTRRANALAGEALNLICDWCLPKNYDKIKEQYNGKS